MKEIISVANFGDNELTTTVSSNDTYSVMDNTSLKELTISKTILRHGKRTKGHSHPQEEVYHFLVGRGVIKLGEKEISIRVGDIVPIQSGLFHQVINTGSIDLHFICIFQKYGDR